jgi:hypothetical protein
MVEANTSWGDIFEKINADEVRTSDLSPVVEETWVSIIGRVPADGEVVSMPLGAFVALERAHNGAKSGEQYAGLVHTEAGTPVPVAEGEVR